MKTFDPKALLKSKEIKVTSKRLSLMELMESFKKPFSAQDLYNLITDEVDIDLATVYRFLNLLHEKKIIRVVLSHENNQYYEIISDEKPLHPHFQCTHCGNIQCLSPISLEDSLPLLKIAGSFQITDVSIILKGCCENCNEIKS